MQREHLGRTRIEETVLASALLVIAIRTALPIGSAGVYGVMAVKLAFGVALAAPALWLLTAHSLTGRRRALMWTFISYAYVGVLVPIVDWTRFGSAAAILALAALAVNLYYDTARKIKWTQARSSRSLPPSAPD